MKWLEDNFEGSYDTAKVYCRIAKKWDDPRLIEARKLGVTLNSINKILDILSGKRLPDGTLDMEPSELEFLRIEIRKMFAEKVRDELSKDDIRILADFWVFDKVWEEWYKIIRDRVIGELGYDPYEYEGNNKFYGRYREGEARYNKIMSRFYKHRSISAKSSKYGD